MPFWCGCPSSSARSRPLTFSRCLRFNLTRHLIVGVGRALHGGLGFRIPCFFRGRAHFLRPRAPVIWIFDEFAKLPHDKFPEPELALRRNADIAQMVPAVVWA